MATYNLEPNCKDPRSYTEYMKKDMMKTPQGANGERKLC